MISGVKRILLVEDNPADARLMAEYLKDSGDGRVELQHVDNLHTALKRLSEQKYDVVLLDLSLPDGKDLDTVGRVCAANPHLPVIVLTGTDDDVISLSAVQAGAQDYLVKGQVDGPGITRAIRYAIERKLLEERLHHLATHDDLTELPNRRLFQDRMAQAIEHANRNRGEKNEKWEIATMLLDLDNFKSVNDTLGHQIGDLLLQSVADRLVGTIRKSDTLARMGGDEFSLIFENVHGEDDVRFLAKKVLEVFIQPFHISEYERMITASIGISLFPGDGEESETLLKHADIAMYYAKREGNKACFYHNYEDCL
jgi:diguanylate cyclase (GGDEF)-like protein